MNCVSIDVSLSRVMEKALTQFKSLFLEMLTPFLPPARQLSKDGLLQSVLKSSVEFWLSDFHGHAKDSASFTEASMFLPVCRQNDCRRHFPCTEEVSSLIESYSLKPLPTLFAAVFLFVETVLSEIPSYLVFLIDFSYNGNSTLS